MSGVVTQLCETMLICVKLCDFLMNNCDFSGTFCRGGYLIGKGTKKGSKCWVVMNPFENLKQMQDQRVAGLSHVNLAPGKCTLPLQEAIALMKQWKEEIGDDAEKFAERVSRSRCEAAA